MVISQRGTEFGWGGDGDLGLVMVGCGVLMFGCLWLIDGYLICGQLDGM